MASVSINSLLDPESGLALTLLAGKDGLRHKIGGSRIQKPGLALTGFTQHVHTERLQVLGLTEISYLRSIDAGHRQSGAEALMGLLPCAVVITRGLEVPAELATAAEQHGVAL